MSLLVSKILQLVYLSAITRIASSERMIEKGSNCGPPTPPYGSTIIYPRNRNEHSNGTVVLFGCKPGFYLVGPSLITCIANSWTEIKFRCIGFCPVFRHIMNVEVIHVSPVIGKAAVEFRCHDKYRLIGRRRLECISGRWNGNIPFCKKLKTCGRLQPPINGNLHGRDTSHGATVSFACFAGFDLFGLRSITCNNGVWSGNVPSCKAYCTRIVKPLNGWKYGTQFSHGSVVLFKCKTGYKLVGDHALQCTNGKWNSSVPICNVMLCPRPSIPSNSYIVHPATTQDHHVHGTRLFLACRSGHFLIGTPVMTCNQTGWIQTEFNCIAFCPVLGSVKNGIVTQVTLKGGGEIEINCKENYTLVGSATLVCSNGAWNDSLPNCSAPCKEPFTPLHGWKSNRDFRHGHSVNFFCYGSYDRIGASSITCNNGTWDEQVPVCKARCRNPGSPIHGRKRGEIYRHNSWVQFLCDVNYLLDGDPWIQCIDGSWSGPVAKCRVIKCGDPGVPLNGKRIVSKGFVYGGSVRFQCNTNYTLMKGMPVAIYCQADKAWSGSLPRCLAPCPDPGVPYQATRIGHDFRHERTVRFTCPTNYRLEGIDEITCSNGRWSGRAPLCKAPCEDLAKPANGWKWGGFRHGSKVTFRCYSGYQKIGTDFTTCNDGTWTSDAPACKGKCDRPRTPYRVRLRGNSFLDGDEVQFSCIGNRFDLFGNQIMRCVGRKWNSRIPECKARCIFPGNPDNGFLLRAFRNWGDMIKHGERITYGCLEGYSLIGTATQECNDGRWTNGRPVCKASCRPPGDIEHGRKIGDSYKHGERVRYQCDFGYTRDGEQELICLDGAWIFDRPICRATCPSLGEPTHGRRWGDDFKDGKTVTFGCNKGYDLFGTETIQCNGGFWNGSIPECKGRCVFTGDALKAFMLDQIIQEGTHLKHGSIVELACEASLELIGPAAVYCNDGQWNASLPACKAVCNDPGPITHGKKDGNDFSHGKHVKYKCDGNYSLEGNHQLTCHDGQWNSDPPLCKDYSSCGESPVDFRARIVGGSTSKKGWWPWQVALKKPSINGGDQLFCGGALISPRWVLTAAHCFYTPDGIFNGDVYKIFAGVHRLDKEEKSEQDILPEKLEIHENYNAKAKTFLNDIALIKLQHEVELKKFVRTLCLPSKEEEDDLAVAGKYGYVSGWGVTRALEMGEETEKGDYSNELKYASYQIQRNALCKNSTTYTFESDAMFCGGDGKGGNDTCSGDSGGVFVREGKRGNGYRWIATGIVSWGEGCAQENKYGYYTRVYSYIDWINKIMTEN